MVIIGYIDFHRELIQLILPKPINPDMNHSIYYNYIEDKLNTLSMRINKNGKLNLLDLHTHSEYFYRDFFNTLYGWDLRNLNDKTQNIEAIDLVDDTKKFLVQVSATNTKAKIDSCLEKKSIKKYLTYTFKFIAISKEADELRSKTYSNPNGINFNPLSDIYDCKSLLKDILSLDTVSMKKIYKFIKTELGNEVDIVKLDSNLAVIINILAKEDWGAIEKPTVNTFEIDRKITFNNLNDSKDIIADYSAHHARVDKIYNEFDTQGVNKSSSVLAKVRSSYIRNKSTKSDDKLFFLVIDNVLNFVIESHNCDEIPIDELELCVNILVVDAFIRCKIFENPNKYNYANS